jgi:single-strand DNA-binding protein
MINSSVIMGRICNDIEVRKTQSGVSVCRFTVAVDRYSKDEEKKTDFIDVVAWRTTGEFVGKYFGKGSMIAIQGSIQTGSYEKDGIKRKTFEIVADNVSFCGGKTEREEKPKNDGFEPVVDDDFDLPF